MDISQHTLEQTRDGFARYFGTPPQALFFSPGLPNIPRNAIRIASLNMLLEDVWLS